MNIATTNHTKILPFPLVRVVRVVRGSILHPLSSFLTTNHTNHTNDIKFLPFSLVRVVRVVRGSILHTLSSFLTTNHTNHTKTFLLLSFPLVRGSILHPHFNS